MTGTREEIWKRVDWHEWLPLLIVFVGGLAYANSFTVPFLLDDGPGIVENLHLHRLWPLESLVESVRPVTDLSFALNYALGGLQVWGYHAVNLAIHLGAGLVLYGLIRRTLLTERLRGRYGPAAPWLALSIALLWVVHPLQTQSVTYLSQRAEALMGLAYLLTLYCLVRGAGSSRRRWWLAGAILSGLLGAASKPIIVTAPLLALLYDRTFLSGSFRQAWRQRRGCYLGLILGCWGLVAFLIHQLPPDVQWTAGFRYHVITPLEYARSQPGVILHYLRLAVWPHPLAFDYAWPVANTVGAIIWPSLLLGAFLAAVVWTCVRRPAVGFLGAWIFLILAPTSSVIPIADLAFEYRMYLPLAGVICLLVLGGDEFFRRLRGPRWSRRILATAVMLSMGGLLRTLTVHRNIDYASEETIWRDTIAKRPTNPRAYNNLGDVLLGQDRVAEAMGYLVEALRLLPTYAEAHSNIGNALFQQGALEDAAAHCREALRLKPDFGDAHMNLGAVLAKQGQLEEAVSHLREALRVKPHGAKVHNDLGVTLSQLGQHEEGMTYLLEALRLDPEYAKAHNNLGVVLADQGRFEEAMVHFTEALRLKPDFLAARQNFASAMQQQKGTDRQATQDLERVSP